jgi:hypothetical protein
MKGRKGFGILLALSVALVSFGCEGDTGPQGPAGPEGPEGPAGPPGTDVSEFAFQGDFGSPCLHCHATTVNDYVTTGHRFAFDDLGAENQSNLYCVQCHTTGFNCTVEFGDTEIDPANCVEPDDGYSGYIGDDSEEGLARKAALEGVQCESCHGAMGPDFNAHVPEISFSTWENSLCAGCHEAQITEWETSGHALAAGGDAEELGGEFGRSSCDYCHTSEGFIRTYDPTYADYDFGGEYSQVGCPTCHDPHVGEDGGGNNAQLRTVDAVLLSYTFPADPDEADDLTPWTVEGYGAGQTCMQCHKARRDNANVLGQIANGYGHFGPHGSPQTDMFKGIGSYEIDGYDYADGRSHPHQGIPDACVTCHMAFSEDAGGHVVHNFMPTLEACQGCHGALDEAGLAALQQVTRDKLDTLAGLIDVGYASWDDLMVVLDDVNADWTVAEREAAYAGVFVYNSGDYGVHNPDYAAALLDNAIDYLTP